MNYFTGIFLLFFSANLFSQTYFEQGYFIDANNNRVDCLIKNIDWKNSPDKFFYKIDESDEVLSKNKYEINEFGIPGKVIFRKYIVQIDNSSNKTRYLEFGQNPVFETDTLMLQVLVDGQVSLLNYKTDATNKFFYKKYLANVQQLVMKKYLVDYSTSRTNNQFRQQLKNEMDCEDEDLISSISNLGYTRNALTSFFMAWNDCINGDYKVFKKKRKKLFKIYAKGEYMRGELNYKRMWTTFPNNIETNNVVSVNVRELDILQYGVSLEYVLPFYNNKWSILLEPVTQQLEGTIEDYSISLTTIEIPIGIRHYFFLNEDSKLFISGQYLVDILTRAEVNISDRLNSESDDVIGDFAFGAGCFYKRFGVELKYKFGKDLLSRYTDRYMNLKGVSASLFVRLY